MLLYLGVFFVVVIAYLVQENQGTTPKNKLLLGTYLTFLAFFVGLADMLGGYDRYIYGEAFDSIADMTLNGENYLVAGAFDFFPEEKGYTILNIIISVFTKNRYIFILLYTLLIYVLLYNSLKKYTENYAFALILFMGLWFFFSFTYLRQVLGATIAWLSLDYIVDRKFFKFLIVVLLAYSIHNSALVFFPLYFVPLKKFDKKIVAYLMIGCLFLGLSPLPTALFAAYGEASESERRGVEYVQEAGFRWAYLIEACFFLYFILKDYGKIPNKPINVLLLNMALVFCAILLFFIKSENGGRLSWYYMIGLIATITYLCTYKQIFTETTLCILIVTSFLYIRVLRSWGENGFQILYPYKTFLTPGHRSPDKCAEQYEYDWGYDKNKFYR